MCAKTRDREASRKAILDSAERLFLEVGVKAASIGAIAKGAGVTKGLVFYHFESKEKLAAAVKTRLHERHALGLGARLADAGEPVDSLFAAFRLYFEFHRNHQAATRMMSWNYMEQAPAHPAMATLRVTVVDLLRQAQAAGTMRGDIDPEAAVIASFSMIEHWFEIERSLALSSAPIQVDHDTYLKTAVALLRQGLLPLEQA